MSFTASKNFVTTPDGFAPPRFGGAVAVKYGTLAFGDAADKNLFTLPAGAVVVDMTVDIVTAFNAATTNTIDVGIAGNDDYFANDLAAGTIATLRYGATGTDRTAFWSTPLTTETQVQATYDQTGTAADAGLARIALWYIVRDI